MLKYYWQYLPHNGNNNRLRKPWSSNEHFGHWLKSLSFYVKTPCTTLLNAIFTQNLDDLPLHDQLHRKVMSNQTVIAPLFRKNHSLLGQTILEINAEQQITLSILENTHHNLLRIKRNVDSPFNCIESPLFRTKNKAPSHTLCNTRCMPH